MRILKRVAGSFLFLVMLGTSMESIGCTTPVFLYAMEMWEQDLYEGVVIYDASEGSRDRYLMDYLKDSVTGNGYLNLYLTEMDISTEKKHIRELLGRNIPEKLPAIVLWYPGQMGHSPPLWSGSLSRSSVQQLRDSRKRKEIGDHLVRGAPVVWIMIKSGNLEKDTATIGKLQRELEYVKNESLNDIYLQPHLEHVKNKSELFPLVVLSRSDLQTEVILSDMLMNFFEGTGGEREPIVFPVFGRGRSLGVLAGSDINAQNIRQVISFLLNPCSCQIKVGNPGFDLMMHADWNELLSNYYQAPVRPVMAGVMPDTTIIETEYENIIDLTGDDRGFISSKIFSAIGIITAGILLVIILSTIFIMLKRKQKKGA